MFFFSPHIFISVLTSAGALAIFIVYRESCCNVVGFFSFFLTPFISLYQKVCFENSPMC